jgi:hypothetical protein
MWGQMKRWLKEGGSYESGDNELHDELIGPETVGRADGIIQLEAKKDMKARGMPSPNRADALALSFAYPVEKKYRTSDLYEAKRKTADWREYDPMKAVYG